jgi:hypothetical protein
MATIRCTEHKRPEQGEPSLLFSKTLTGGLAGLLGLMLFLASASSVHVAWYDSNWQCRERLTSDYTEVAATLSHFAVLVSLTSDGGPAVPARSASSDSLAQRRISISTNVIDAWLMKIHQERPV